ncbi:MAG: hypothetical protein IKZ98_01090 [Clostridia bacterium]|nr:hypothetical protein [Clostridia bacterium]
MDSSVRNTDPEAHKEQLKQLYLSQKQTLDTFLQNGAITKAQYDKSLGDLTRKMGITPEKE